MINPRAVALWSASALAMVLLGNNPVYRLLVALAALAFVGAAARAAVALRPLLILAASAVAISVVVNLAFGHAGDHVLATVPRGIPALGGVITLESLLFGVSNGVGVCAALFSAAPLSLVLEPHELLSVVPAAFSRTGVALAASSTWCPGWVGASAPSTRRSACGVGPRAGCAPPAKCSCRRS